MVYTEFRISADHCSQTAAVQPAVGADGHMSTRVRLMCVISICTRGALHTLSRRRRSTASLEVLDADIDLLN